MHLKARDLLDNRNMTVVHYKHLHWKNGSYACRTSFWHEI